MRILQNLKLRLINAMICQASTFILAPAIAFCTGPPQSATLLAFLCRPSARSCKSLLSSRTTARSIRIDNESSKLLLLTPHNDTVKGIIDALGVPSDHFPPSLYYYYLSMLFRIHHLPSHLEAFPRYDHMGNLVTTKLDSVSLMEIYHYIIKDPALVRGLEARATLPAIVDIALTHPKGFSAYCTVSNTVKAELAGSPPASSQSRSRISLPQQGSSSPQPCCPHPQQRSLCPLTVH